MKKTFALVLALLLTLLVATDFFVIKNYSPPNRQEVFVTRVIDGDTLELENNISARLVNINTPEKGEKGYEEAKTFLSQIENSTVEIEELGSDKYGRLLVRVYASDYMNLQIVENGLATKFLVYENELKDFEEAEYSAIEEEKGIWRKSEFYGCFTSSILPEEEILLLENQCESLNLQDWTLKDESRKKYKFPNISLGEVTIHTIEGDDNETDIFMSFPASVWNNDRDTIYLLDKENDIVYASSYGY